MQDFSLSDESKNSKETLLIATFFNVRSNTMKFVISFHTSSH